MPAEPVRYLYHSGPPGIVRTMAVLSIVVASISLVACVVHGAINVWMNNAASFVNLRASATKNNKPAIVNPAEGSDASSDGFNKRDRQIIISALRRIRPLSEPRQKQLDALLADSGQLMIHLDSPDLQIDRVIANVSDHGQLPSARGNDGPDFFVLGEGRLEVDDHHAVFFPTDGRSPIRAEGGIAADNSEPAMLSDAQARAVVDRIENMAGRSLPEPQKAGIRKALLTPGQQLIQPSTSVAGATAQIGWVEVDESGSVFVESSTMVISFLPDGQINNNNNNAGKPVTLDQKAAGLSVTVTGLSFVLAAYLLTIGILTLRQSPRGALLHWIYVAAKIPLAIFGGYAGVKLWTSFQTATNGNSHSAIVFWTIFTIIACVYPVLLAVMLLCKPTRDYYRSAG